MKALNEWAIKNLGAWVTDGAALFLILAVGMLVILLITFIIVANRHAHNKKKFKKLKEQAADGSGVDEAALREQIRAEVEAEHANADNDDAIAEYSQTIETLSAENDNKQRIIDELNARLSDANAARANDGGDNAQLIERIDALTRENNELADKNAELAAANTEFNEAHLELQNELSLLKAENAQIKAQALQQQLAAERDKTAAAKSAAATEQAPSAQKSAPAAKPAGKPATSAKPTAAEKAPAAKAKKDDGAPTQEDEYDEYYDDYGDENSAIKVTLKFDRNKNNWVILRTDTDRAYRRLATKQEALTIAKDLARRLHAQLVVHKKDGKFQRI